MEEKNDELANQLAKKHGFQVVNSVPGSDNVYVLESNAIVGNKRAVNNVNAIQALSSENGVVKFEQEKRLRFSKR